LGSNDLVLSEDGERIQSPKYILNKKQGYG
jgi:hypothetical protein